MSFARQPRSPSPGLCASTPHATLNFHRLRGAGFLRGLKGRPRPARRALAALGQPPPGPGDNVAPHDVLGVALDASEAQVRAAFRAKIKTFHPDVYSGPKGEAQELTIQAVQAYEVLLKRTRVRDGSGWADNGEEGEEEEEGVLQPWVNELCCQGRGCRYSCVVRAPNTFFYAPDTGRARRRDPELSRGEGDGEYTVQLAVGQCPEECIHWVSREQRQSLQELLHRIAENSVPYSYGARELAGMVSQFEFENNRRPPPKRNSKGSSSYVHWY